MSNKRYIEVYSARRNRNLYPYVSSFIIPLEESGLKTTAATAYDPVILAFPYYQFKLNTASSTPPTSSVYNFPGGGKKSFGVGSSPSVPIINIVPSSNVENFYNGYRLIDTTINESRTITSYDNTSGICTLDKPFSDQFNDTDCYITQDPSVPFDSEVLQTATGNIAGTAANPILNFSGVAITPTPNFSSNGFPIGYFSGYYVQIINATTGYVREERRITDMVQLGVGSNFYQLSLDNDFSLDWSAAGLGNSIFKITTKPIPYIHLQPTDIYNFNNPANYDQFYTGNIIFNELTNEGREVIGYSANLRLAGLKQGFTSESIFNPTNLTEPSAPTGTCATGPIGATGYYGPTTPAGLGPTGNVYADPVFSVRQELPCFVGDFTGTVSMGSQVVNFSPTTNFYGSLPKNNGAWGKTVFSPNVYDPNSYPGIYPPNCCTPLSSNNDYLYIRPLSFSYNDIPSAKNIYLIKQYFGENGGTGPNLSGNDPQAVAYGPYSAILDRPIEVPVGTGCTGGCLEVLKFSYDNFAPLCYNGSKVSQQEQVCYEIQLLSLVLPNVTLKSGSRISFYPFIYVQFGTTIGSSMNHTDCVIYSNNPHSKKALFVAPTTDVSNPLTSQFIKLDGNGATQTVKFKPNENLVFSVFLPNGELFLPVIPDNYSPLPPNPLVQIEAYFSIKRL